MPLIPLLPAHLAPTEAGVSFLQISGLCPSRFLELQGRTRNPSCWRPAPGRMEIKWRSHPLLISPSIGGENFCSGLRRPFWMDGKRYGLVLPFGKLRINLASELVSKLGLNSTTGRDTLNPAPPRFLDLHARTRNDMAFTDASLARVLGRKCGKGENLTASEVLEGELEPPTCDFGFSTVAIPIAVASCSHKRKGRFGAPS